MTSLASEKGMTSVATRMSAEASDTRKRFWGALSARLVNTAMMTSTLPNTVSSMSRPARHTSVSVTCREYGLARAPPPGASLPFQLPLPASGSREPMGAKLPSASGCSWRNMNAGARSPGPAASSLPARRPWVLLFLPRPARPAAPHIGRGPRGGRARAGRALVGAHGPGSREQRRPPLRALRVGAFSLGAPVHGQVLFVRQGRD